VSSKKPEVHDVTQRCQKKIEATTGNSLEVRFLRNACEHTDMQTHRDRQTDGHSPGGRKTVVVVVVVPVVVVVVVRKTA